MSFGITNTLATATQTVSSIYLVIACKMQHSYVNYAAMQYTGNVTISQNAVCTS